MWQEGRLFKGWGGMVSLREWTLHREVSEWLDGSVPAQRPGCRRPAHARCGLVTIL